jgi:hypothetical protein
MIVKVIPSTFITYLVLPFPLSFFFFEYLVKMSYSYPGMWLDMAVRLIQLDKYRKVMDARQIKYENGGMGMKR